MLKTGRRKDGYRKDGLERMIIRRLHGDETLGRFYSAALTLFGILMTL